MTDSPDQEPQENASEGTETTAKCGIVMPISDTEGYPPGHWREVQDIFEEAIKSAGFIPKLVSDSSANGIIQKLIVDGLYNDDIILCDVSSKNANVMLELGMRLAFDKAIVVVKDDRTTYSFDTSPIKHLQYPRDLRHKKIEDFQDDLKGALRATFEDKDQKYSFLKAFGTFERVDLESETVEGTVAILQMLTDIQREMRTLSNGGVRRSPSVAGSQGNDDGSRSVPRHNIVAGNFVIDHDLMELVALKRAALMEDRGHSKEDAFNAIVSELWEKHKVAPMLASEIAKSAVSERWKNR